MCEFFCVKVDKIFISYFGIIIVLLSQYLHHVVRADGMVGTGIWSVPTLEDGAVILHATIGGTEVSTFGGAGSPTLCAVYVDITLVWVPGLFSQA